MEFSCFDLQRRILINFRFALPCSVLRRIYLSVSSPSFCNSKASASSTLTAMAIITNPPRRKSAPARMERSDDTGSATNPNERTHLLLSLVHHRNEQSLQECPTLQRVEKQTRQRVRWACERCRASLVQNQLCPECEHKRCTQCVRDP